VAVYDVTPLLGLPKGRPSSASSILLCINIGGFELVLLEKVGNDVNKLGCFLRVFTHRKHLAVKQDYTSFGRVLHKRNPERRKGLNHKLVISAAKAAKHVIV
jgi:hypothetical protein